MFQVVDCRVLHVNIYTYVVNERGPAVVRDLGKFFFANRPCFIFFPFKPYSIISIYDIQQFESSFSHCLLYGLPAILSI